MSKQNRYVLHFGTLLCHPLQKNDELGDHIQGFMEHTLLLHLSQSFYAYCSCHMHVLLLLQPLQLLHTLQLLQVLDKEVNNIQIIIIGDVLTFYPYGSYP